MKTLHILIGLVSAGALAMGGTVTIPNTFHANTTAKAAEVNANFTAVKNAVNDNAGKITTNKNDIATNKSDIQTNATAIDQKVTDIAVNGGLDVSRTGNDVTLKLRDGYVGVNGSAFSSVREDGDHCVLYRDWMGPHRGLYFHTSGSAHANCSAFADVQIPNNVKVKSMTCRVIHNYSGTVAVRLYMQNRSYTPGFPPTIGNIQKTKLIEVTLGAGDTSSDTQEMSGTYTPPPFVVWNPTYKSYYIEWDPPATNTSGTNEKLFDCKVDYEY